LDSNIGGFETCRIDDSVSIPYLSSSPKVPEIVASIIDSINCSRSGAELCQSYRHKHGATVALEQSKRRWTSQSMHFISGARRGHGYAVLASTKDVHFWKRSTQDASNVVLTSSGSVIEEALKSVTKTATPLGHSPDEL
jgi:hypothetical protein